MIPVSAQISLYPLRQPDLSPAIEEVLATFRAHGLEVCPGEMSTQVRGEDARVFDALREAFRKGAAKGPVVMVVTLSNACPVPGGQEGHPA